MGKHDRAQKLYKEFNGKEPDEIIEIEGVSFPELVHLGKCESIAYESSKEGKPTFYKHEFGEETGEMPEMYCNLEGDTIVIHGGHFRIEKRPGDKVAWIID